jgi:hypothetical protein
VIELTAQRSDEGARWFNRVMSIIGKGQKTDDQRFSQMHQVVEAVAQSQSEQIDRFSAAEQERQEDKAAIKLTTELAELRQKLVSTEASFSQRPPANGGASAAG